MLRAPHAYLIDLKAAGIKDRELERLIVNLDRVNRQHIEAYTALEKARREHAATDAELERLVSDAVLAGEEVPALSELRAERDAALHAAERTEAGVRDARDRAAREIETYIGNHEADLRGQVRKALDKRADARRKSEAAYLADLEAETGALGALLWCQEIPRVVGSLNREHDDPSADRDRLRKAYDTHPAVSRVRQAVREVDDALEAPTEQQIAVAQETSTRGYLKDATSVPKNLPTLTQADLAGAMR